MALSYLSDKEDRSRLGKAYVGEVTLSRLAYNIQTHFDLEGYFEVKVTLMGGNLCLLEESEDGVNEDLIGVGET